MTRGRPEASGAIIGRIALPLVALALHACGPNPPPTTEAPRQQPQTQPGAPARPETPDRVNRGRGGLTITVPDADVTPAPAPDTDGIFYLLDRVAFRGPGGLRGYPPGTAVNEMFPGTYEIDGFTAQIPREKLADTPAAARRIFEQRANTHRLAQEQLLARQRAAHAATTQPAPPTNQPAPPLPAPHAPIPATPPVVGPVPHPPPAIAPAQPGQPGTPATATAQKPPGPADKTILRSYTTKSGQTYHVKVRGGEVSE